MRSAGSRRRESGTASRRGDLKIAGWGQREAGQRERSGVRQRDGLRNAGGSGAGCGERQGCWLNLDEACRASASGQERSRRIRK